MKRQIQFRGKSKSTNTWLYGDLLRNEQGAFAVVPPFKMNMGNECNLYEVYPDTVCQFTGLYDKNRKAVYEGDMLKIKAYNNEAVGIFKYDEIKLFTLDEIKGSLTDEFFGEVIFEEGCFFVKDIFLSALFGDMRYSNPIYEFEVVGNISEMDICKYSNLL